MGLKISYGFGLVMYYRVDSVVFKDATPPTKLSSNSTHRTRFDDPPQTRAGEALWLESLEAPEFGLSWFALLPPSNLATPAEFIAPIMASSLRIMSSYQFIELCPGTGLATNNYPRWIFKPVCVLYLIKWTRRFRPMITTTLLLFSLCSVDLRALFIADLELLFGCSVRLLIKALS